MLFVHYPKCTTCRRAAAWLEAQGLSGEKEEGQHQGQRQSGTADAVDKAMCGHARHPI